MEHRNLENSKIRQVARNYEKKGYKVIVEPRGKDVPSFIKNYQPDIIALSEAENVVIEVKTRSDFSTIESLRDVADVINSKDNWRFELIVTRSKQLDQPQPEKANLDLLQIKDILKASKELMNRKLFSPAFIICWAALESLSRQLLLEDKKTLHNKTPIVLIKTLFSFGYLTRTDYEILDKLFTIRNQVVHGYQATGLDKGSVAKLLRITEKLLSEKR